MVEARVVAIAQLVDCAVMGQLGVMLEAKLAVVMQLVYSATLVG